MVAGCAASCRMMASTCRRVDPVTTARISRHLIDMGIDPVLWLHALDTPPQALYYFSAAEMAKYRLVTAPVSMAGRMEPAR